MDSSSYGYTTVEIIVSTTYYNFIYGRALLLLLLALVFAVLVVVVVLVIASAAAVVAGDASQFNVAHALLIELLPLFTYGAISTVVEYRLVYTVRTVRGRLRENRFGPDQQLIITI